MQGGAGDISEARNALATALGERAVVDTSAVIAMFNIMDRIADATGIPVDEGVAHDARYRIGNKLGMGHLTPEQRSAE